MPEKNWGAGLWKHFEASGTAVLTPLGREGALTYDKMKEALCLKYGLTPEQYRVRFRDFKKRETSTWVECVRDYTRALDGWMKGSKVTVFEGLYHLISWEHFSSLCVPELRQHLLLRDKQYDVPPV